MTSTINYAAPVIALCLSALLRHEPLNFVKLVSGGLELAGVALMIDRGLPAPTPAVVLARSKSL